MDAILTHHPTREGGGLPDPSLASPRFFPAVARGILLAIVLVVYLGAMPYLILVSPLLLYGLYVTIMGAIAVILFFEWSAVRDLRWVAPYITWVLFYCYWGSLVAPPEMSLEEVARTFLKTALVIGALALSVTGLPSLRRFAGWVQVVAIVNAGIAIWEIDRPDVIVKLARAHDPMATAFNVERPAGIWSNPDEASFAYLFALMISCWGRGPIIWIGRVACVVGIFLTASRTGAYVLTLCTLLLIIGKIGRLRWHPKVIGLVLLGLVAIVAAGMTAATLAPDSAFDFSQSRQLQRIADFSETDVRSDGQLGRTDIAKLAAAKALDGPWYGHGIYTFQMEPHDRFAALSIGAHNFFITVWGEAGIPGGISIFLLLAYGFSRLFRSTIEKEDRLILMLFWFGYLVIGLTWHNQITSFAGMLYSGALWHLPGILSRREDQI